MASNVAEPEESHFYDSSHAELVLPTSDMDVPTGHNSDTPRRSEPGHETTTPRSFSRPPDPTHKFQHEFGPNGSSLTGSRPTPSSSLQDMLNSNTDKAGLCIICCCTNPCNGEAIECCTAHLKMIKCFKDDLGYLTYEERRVMSINTMRQLLEELGSLKIPPSCCDSFRVFFYFFGHGNESEICLTNGNIARSEIISKLQNIDKNRFKIVLFESCRTEEGDVHDEIPMESPVQETNHMQSLPGGSWWKEQEKYPDVECVNTLIINATTYKGEAFYCTSDDDQDMKGCGYVTYFFTMLASSLNQPLSAVLAEVRKEVDSCLRKQVCSANDRAPQVLVYNDLLMGNINLLAESKGNRRLKPEEVKCVTISPLTTTIQWEFHSSNKRITFRLICRDGEGKNIEIKEQLSMKNVAWFNNESLHAETEYHLKVVAMYKDDHFESESDEISFEVPALNGTKIQDFELTSLFPLKLKVTWNVPEHDPSLVACSYEVWANEKRFQCNETNAELDQLNPGTRYEIRIVTHFRDRDVCITRETKEPYTTPSSVNLVPTIECSQIERNSAVVKVSDPPVLQQRDHFHTPNISVQRVTLKCTPYLDEEELGIGRKINTNQEVTLFGIIPGKEYKVKCEMVCNTHDQLTAEKIITSAQPRCIQKILSSMWWIYIFFLILCLVSLGLAMSYVRCYTYLWGDNSVKSWYASTDTAIKCGTGNSLHYKRLNLKGAIEADKADQGIVKAWIISQRDLKFYIRDDGPYPTEYQPEPGDHYIPLFGWRKYLWEETVINGHCCVHNNNGTKQTASLFLFTRFEDSLNFRSGKPPKNYLLYEELTIPQGDENCFTEWGQNKTFTVQKSSNYFFVLQLSADNMNFTAEISYHLRYVNTSEYSNSHTFEYDGQTYFEYPSDAQTEYVAVCEAPGYRGENLRINSWGSHYRSKTKLISVLSVSIIVFTYSALVFSCIVVYHKCLSRKVKKICTCSFSKVFPRCTSYDEL